MDFVAKFFVYISVYSNINMSDMLKTRTLSRQKTKNLIILKLHQYHFVPLLLNCGIYIMCWNDGTNRKTLHAYTTLPSYANFNEKGWTL